MFSNAEQAAETAESIPTPTVTEELEDVQEPKSTTDLSTASGEQLSSLPEKDAIAPTAVETSPALEIAKAPTNATEEPKLAPAKECKPSTTSEKDGEPTIPATPRTKLFNELPSIIEQAGHDEMWGITLTDESHVPSSIVLEKFLRANDKDVAKAKAQLIEALKWRKQMNPLKLLSSVEFDTAKFGNLGYVTTYQRADGKGKEVITWNIYGGAKDLKSTFGDVKEFIKWRCALMEISVKELDLSFATAKIPENGPDPYRMVQVHDYLNVGFLRMDPAVRASSKETIQVFSIAYPELLKEKFFVNVPLVMGWVFSAMKIFLSEATIKKFHPLSNGGSLARELPGFGDQLPKVYGGKGGDIKEGLTVKYASGTDGAEAFAATAEGDKQTEAEEEMTSAA